MGRRRKSFLLVLHQKIIAPSNEEIDNEFSAMLQYYAIAELILVRKRYPSHRPFPKSGGGGKEARRDLVNSLSTPVPV
jgi:hypothetical protein